MATRKLAGFFFLFVIVFNTIGNYSILIALKKQFGEEVTKRMKSGKPEPGGSLIVKVPLALPYSSISNEYEPSVSEIVFEGNIYHPIKQRYVDDTLYLVCIVDQQATKVANQIKDLSNSFAGDSKEQSSGIKLTDLVSKYYHLSRNIIVNSNIGWTINYSFGEHSNLYSHPLADLIFHPPQSNSIFII